MDAAQTLEDPPNPLHQLSASAYRFVVHQLYQDLPPPFGTDPEHTALVIEASIARIASMLPANAYEAEIATRIVTADAQASDCIRHARTLFNDPKPAMKCHAMANSYMRTANAACSLLLRIQTARHKREALPANCDQDAWVEHCAAGLMAAAAKGDPAPEPPPPPVPSPARRAVPRPPTNGTPATAKPSSMPSTTPTAPPRSVPMAVSRPPPATATPSSSWSARSSPAPAPSSGSSTSNTTPPPPPDKTN